MAKRIVLLFHERDRRRDLRCYAITHLAALWRSEGLGVEFAFGTRRFAPADLAILHVDLSVVPEAYLDLARRYPIALNAGVADIRKSRISGHRVRPGDPWRGPVLVKSDLNFAGKPERRFRPLALRLLAAAALPWTGRSPAVSKRGYRVFERLDAVPARLLSDPRVVVEKFLPERTPEGYATRSSLVLGGRIVGDRRIARVPIVGDRTTLRVEPVDPAPETEEVCRRWRLDYGKIDYTIHEGRFTLLDVNKTVGATRALDSDLARKRRVQAAGIHDYLEGRFRPR